MADAQTKFYTAKDKLLNCKICSKKIEEKIDHGNKTYFDEYGGLGNIENPKNIVQRILDEIKPVVCESCKNELKIMQENLIKYSSISKALKLH